MIIKQRMNILLTYHSNFFIIQIMQQPKILVAIRKRPLNQKQQLRGQSDIISVKTSETVIVSEYKQKVDLTKYLQETVFNFDFAYHQEATNQEIYETAVRPLVDSAFQGAKVTCFAYGQTGSGKTFTMNGVPSKGIVGLYTLGAQDIFAYLADPRYSHLKARLSFFQIYCGKLFDLLNKRQQLKIREDNKANINIIGLQEIVINSWQQFIELLNYGGTNRVTSQNSANLDSSRSHAILQISLKDGKKLLGKISFIDLAGNQRGADHMDMSKQTRIDGAEINKSLLSLKECIRALDQGKGHTPFRGSKLTMVLKDSFVGFCRTVMIGNISPSGTSSQNTLNTLRYADRVKQLRKPGGGQVSKQEQKAREMMLPRQNKNVLKIDIEKDDDAEDIQQKRQNAQKSMKFISDDGMQNNNAFNQNNNGMKRQGSNGNFVNQQPQQIQGQLPIPIKQPNNNNNAMKINMGNNRKSPMIGTLSSQRQKNQVPGLSKGYSEDNNLQTPDLLFKNNSMNVNQYHEPIGPNRKIGNTKATSSKMDIENDTNVHNNSYMGGNRQPQNNNYFRPTGNNSSSSGHSGTNNPSNPNNPNNPYGSSSFGTKQQPPNLKSKPSLGMPMDVEKEDALRFRNNRPQQSMGQPQYIQKSQNQSIPPLFVQSPSTTNGSPQNNEEFDVPNNWQEAIQMIQNTNNPDMMLRLQDSISQNLIAQESNLMQKHSNTLRKQIDTIKEQMGLISRVQMDKNSINTRQYVAFLQENIEEKLSSLQLLRQHLAQFTYKLDQMQQIQERVKTVLGDGSANIDDEQLLDDLH